VLSSAIVTPPKPPRLVRTRPDKRIGEIVSIYGTPQRSIHGPNGPPVSDRTSFYFHHKDPDFEKLLPQVDGSRYQSSDAVASKENQNGVHASDLKDTSSTTKCTAASQGSESTVSSVSADSDENVSTRPIHSSKDTQPTLEHTCSRDIIPEIPHEQEIAPNKSAICPAQPYSMPAPTITMSSTGPETLGVRNGKVFVDLADITDTNGMAHSFPVTALASSHLPDTQESFTSTQ